MNNEFSNDDIVCIIDPDDFLPHDYFFSMLNRIYAQKELYMTYGSMGYINSTRRFGERYSFEEFNNARQLTWRAVHLRTFKFHVFKELMVQDPTLNCFKDSDGNFLKMPYDMALMFPMMEICGYDRVKFINSIMYKYRLHDNNDMYINRAEQYRGEMIIRNKPKLKQSDFLGNTD